MNPDHIAILADSPDGVAAKSPLAQFIGGRKTAQLYRAMLFDTYAVCLNLPRVDITVHYQPADALDQFQQLQILFEHEEENRIIAKKSGHLALFPQKGSTNVKRMESVINALLDKGPKRVVLIGGDCPELNTNIIRAGFLLLKKRDVVVGPSFDGKFYLLGMSRFIPEAFAGLNGDEPDFFVRFKNNLAKSEASVEELELSYMVNGPAELNQLIDDIDRWRKIGDCRTALHTERFLMTLSTF